MDRKRHQLEDALLHAQSEDGSGDVVMVGGRLFSRVAVESELLRLTAKQVGGYLERLKSLRQKLAARGANGNRPKKILVDGREFGRRSIETHLRDIEAPALAEAVKRLGGHFGKRRIVRRALDEQSGPRVTLGGVEFHRETLQAYLEGRPPDLLQMVMEDGDTGDDDSG